MDIYHQVESLSLEELQMFSMHTCILYVGMLPLNSNLARMFLPIMSTYAVNKYINNTYTEDYEVQSQGMFILVKWWVQKQFNPNECQSDRTGIERVNLNILFIPRSIEETPLHLSPTLQFSELPTFKWPP